MKRLLYTAFLVFSLLSCSKTNMDSTVARCTVTDNYNRNHPKSELLQRKLQSIVEDGIPGAVLAIYDADGFWANASGFAKIEDSTPMEICHLQYGQSVAKTYMAVIILKLKEEGKINLDDKITQYLSADVLENISDAEKITVRMLLNHTSGVPEYNDKPKYVTYLLQHPLHEFTTMDYLEFVKGFPLVFEPGSEYRYTNTNYELLALIADALIGNHSAYLEDQILNPNGLINTFYHYPGFLEQEELVNSYWDRFSNGQIENCTEMQKVNVASMIGDDGIIATPLDYIRFLRALLGEGKILKNTTLQEMLTFVQKEEGKQDGYGLGIHEDYYRGFKEYGHSGGGIGSACLLGYFPEKNVYYFLGINVGTSIVSPNFDDLEDKIHELYDVLLEI